MSQDGYNKNLNLNESSSGALKVPVLYLSSGISPTQVGSTASNIDSAFDNGTTPSMYRPLDGNKRPYSSQWNLTIERQLPHNFFASISYVGTKGTHLPSSLSPLNVLNPNNPAIAAIGTDLNVKYTDPNGPATFLAHGVNIPYPGWVSQMTGLRSNYPTGTGALSAILWFIAGRERTTRELDLPLVPRACGAAHFKRLVCAWVVDGAEAYSNSTYSTQATSSTGQGAAGNDAAFSPYNIGRAWALAPDNVPITGQLAIVYDLPFGTNKPFLNNGRTDEYADQWMADKSDLPVRVRHTVLAPIRQAARLTRWRVHSAKAAFRELFPAS